MQISEVWGTRTVTNVTKGVLFALGVDDIAGILCDEALGVVDITCILRFVALGVVDITCILPFVA